MDFLRVAQTFESRDGTQVYTFPVDDMEYETAQEYRRAEQPAVGADYAYDLAGAAPWPAAVAEETVRFTIWKDTAAAADTEFDLLVKQCRNIGLGKLFTVDAAGARRWCWAKLTGRPTYIVTVDQFYNMPVEVTFARYSDWFAATLTTGSQTITASPTVVSITNPGNAPARFVVFRLRSNSAAGFTDPSLLNLANAYQVGTSRDAVSVDSEVRIDTERHAVEWSTNNGASYADDFANVTLGATQVGLMQLDPGAQNIQVTCGGTPNFDLEWSFYAPFR